MKQLIFTKNIRLILTVLISSTMFGCSVPTKIVKSWRETNATVQQGTAGKTLILAMVKDETSRRIVEDQLVKRIGSNAIASYTVFTADMLKDTSGQKFSDKLKQDQYKYVILMRLADVEKETSYVPGTTTGYYGGYGRYYGYGAGFYSTPGYYTTDKNYFIETTVYSVEPDKLLWTVTTKTINPKKLEKTVNEIADAVSDKMRKDGFLK
jgi:hypothetical protein